MVVRGVVVVAGWAALSIVAGTLLCALGAGTLSIGWVVFSSGFCAMFFSPLLLAISDN